jgi:indolepyruvate ferredoxin oxidoreductase beta subunit
LTGVGGQGVLTASEILSDALIDEGYDVKKAEVHGMSQRGGSVNSHLRYGEKVYSPLIEEGSADLIFSFEVLETIRFSKFLKENGKLVVNNMKIIPNSVYFSDVKYPKNPDKILKEVFKDNIYLFDAFKIAKDIGNAKFANVVMLGAISKIMGISDKSMEKAIENRVPPKTIEGNLKAFRQGKELV